MNLAKSLTKLVPTIESVLDVGNVGGGCISDSRRVEVRINGGDRVRLFVKSNDASFADNFACERDGLDRLRTVGALSVPQTLATGVVDDRAWMVMQWVETARQGSDFFASFGHGLANLHRSTLGTKIGLERDNYLGASVQINSPAGSWTDFVAEHRIGFQLRMAVDLGLADTTLCRDTQRIIDRMDDLLAGRDAATSLIHGDLWSGNYLCDSEQDPVIIDPAVYYGCREAEFGMLMLYGNCPGEFYEAYDEGFPRQDGCQRRTGVYLLYHLLNHLNLFGGGYLNQCRRVAADVLS